MTWLRVGSVLGLAATLAAGCASQTSAPPRVPVDVYVAPADGGPSATSEPPPQPRSNELVFKYFYPGYLPGWFGRTTLRLEVMDQHARLSVTTEKPANDERGVPNPKAWAVDGSTSLRLEARVQLREDGATYWLETGTPNGLALVCRNSTAVVHSVGATVEWSSCSPCYGSCGSTPVWTPATTRTRAGAQCVLRLGDDVGSDGVETPGDHLRVRELPGLGNAQFLPDDQDLFFTPAPGVEHLVGTSDCPPAGLRETP